MRNIILTTTLVLLNNSIKDSYYRVKLIDFTTNEVLYSDTVLNKHFSLFDFYKNHTDKLSEIKERFGTINIIPISF